MTTSLRARAADTALSMDTLKSGFDLFQRSFGAKACGVDRGGERLQDGKLPPTGACTFSLEATRSLSSADVNLRDSVDGQKWAKMVVYNGRWGLQTAKSRKRPDSFGQEVHTYTLQDMKGVTLMFAEVELSDYNIVTHDTHTPHWDSDRDWGISAPPAPKSAQAGLESTSGWAQRSLTPTLARCHEP